MAWELSYSTSCCCSVAQSCPTLCDPRDCSTPGFPVLHYLLEFAKLMSIVSVMLSNHFILCHPLLLLPSIFPRISLFQCIVVVVQSSSHVQLFTTPLTAAHQSSLSFSISRNLFRLMCIESVMPSNHLILCRPLPLLPSVFPSIRVFSNELALLSNFTKSYFANDLTKKNSQKENRVNSWRLWSGS